VDWVGAFGDRTSWSDFSGDATLEVAAGLKDPSGNVSSATSASVQFLDVPLAAAFGGSTAPGTWGEASSVSRRSRS